MKAYQIKFEALKNDMPMKLSMQVYLEMGRSMYGFTNWAGASWVVKLNIKSAPRIKGMMEQINSNDVMEVLPCTRREKRIAKKAM